MLFWRNWGQRKWQCESRCHHACVLRFLKCIMCFEMIIVYLSGEGISCRDLHFSIICICLSGKLDVYNEKVDRALFLWPKFFILVLSSFFILVFSGEMSSISVKNSHVHAAPGIEASGSLSEATCRPPAPEHAVHAASASPNAVFGASRPRGGGAAANQAADCSRPPCLSRRTSGPLGPRPRRPAASPPTRRQEGADSGARRLPTASGRGTPQGTGCPGLGAPGRVTVLFPKAAADPDSDRRR